MLYVAYGSNINKSQMQYRIPGAKPYGKGVVYNWQLAFHGNDGNAYATILQSPGKSVPVVIWEMSDKDEAIMDRYEGYPKSYYKKKIPVHVDNKKLEGTVYIMDDARKVARPSRKYVNTIRQGYESFGLDVAYLTAALERNSQEYYLDDLLEVRELKKFKTKNVTYVKSGTGKKKKSKFKNTFKWKTTTSTPTHPDFVSDPAVPVTMGDYLKGSFPTDPYWSQAYPCYDDDYDSMDSNTKKKPSLDEYDRYDERTWYPQW